MKKEDEVSEGWTLAESIMIGQYFSLDDDLRTYKACL